MIDYADDPMPDDGIRGRVIERMRTINRPACVTWLEHPAVRLEVASGALMIYAPMRSHADAIARKFFDELMAMRESIGVDSVEIVAEKKPELKFAAAIPKRFQGVELSNSIRKLVEIGKQHLILSGGTGTGKTTQLWALKKYLGDQGIPMLIISEIGDVQENQWDRKVWLPEIKEFTGWIGYDDLACTADESANGTRTLRGWPKEVIGAIADYRWQHNLPFVITTNLTAQSAKAVLGSAIASRLASSNWIEREFSGEDRRIG